MNLSVNYFLYPRESRLLSQDNSVNVINFMGESLYGSVDQNILAFKNIVSCAYKEVDDKIVSGPEYQMVPDETTSSVYHNLTFVDMTQSSDHLAVFSCDKTTVYDAVGSKLYQHNYDNFVNLYADSRPSESTSGTSSLIVILEATTAATIILSGFLVRCVA